MDTGRQACPQSDTSAASASATPATAKIMGIPPALTMLPIHEGLKLADVDDAAVLL